MMHSHPNTKNVFSVLCRSKNKEVFFPLYNINWLVFTNQNKCVYCEVRTEYLNTMWLIFFFKWVMEIYATGIQSTPPSPQHTHVTMFYAAGLKIHMSL